MKLRLTFLLLVLLSGNAEAHLLKLFVYVEGNWLHGSVYFAGGSAASGATVQITDKASGTIKKLFSDVQGEFKHVVEAADYRITADTGDGHRAEWLIHSSEFAEDPLPTLMSKKPSGQTSGGVAPAPDDRHIALLVERAVAKQVGPLRRDLQRASERAKLSDILGGVGFIFGLGGVLLWWHGRKKGGHAGDSG